MRTLGVVGSLFSLMHTLVLFGSPFVMMADVWFGRESCVFTLLACFTAFVPPPALVAAAAIFNVQSVVYFVCWLNKCVARTTNTMFWKLVHGPIL